MPCTTRFGSCRLQQRVATPRGHALIFSLPLPLLLLTAAPGLWAQPTTPGVPTSSEASAAGTTTTTTTTTAAAVPGTAQQGLPLWEVGVIGLAVSQQAYPGSSQRIDRALPLPYLVYRGALLRADRDGVGLRAIRTPTLEVDVGVAASLGASSDDINARRGMPKLGTLVEFGPRLKWKLLDDVDGRGSSVGDGRLRAEFALRGVFDLSDGLRSRGATFEPKLVYEESTAGVWRWSTSASAVFGNRRLADTFYGVAPQYATADRPAYAADSGLIAWRFGANASRPLTPNLRLFTFVRLDALAGAANNASPLVERRRGTTAGVTLLYTFARSSTLVGN